MAPLMFLIETISHLARILSLTVRLYANMFAGSADAGVLFVDPDRRSSDLPGSAHFYLVYPGLCVHAPDHDLSLSGSCARTLRAGISC
jgi:hypothetical protein